MPKFEFFDIYNTLLLNTGLHFYGFYIHHKAFIIFWILFKLFFVNVTYYIIDILYLISLTINNKGNEILMIKKKCKVFINYV